MDNVRPCFLYEETASYQFGAIELLNEALMEEASGRTELMQLLALEAASFVVGWRKGLADQGVKEPDYPDRFSDQELLRLAMHQVLWADGELWAPSQRLRFAEAALRTIWRRHQGKSFGTSMKTGVGPDVPIPVVGAEEPIIAIVEVDG